MFFSWLIFCEFGAFGAAAQDDVAAFGGEGWVYNENISFYYIKFVDGKPVAYGFVEEWVGFDGYR